MNSFQNNLVYSHTQDLCVLGVLNNRELEILKLLDHYQASQDRVCNPSNQYILSKLSKISYKSSSFGEIVGLKSIAHVNNLLGRLEKCC